MSVKILVPPFLLPMTGGKERIETAGRTVGECIEDMLRKHPAARDLVLNQAGKLHSYIGIFINGQDAYPDEMSKPVKDGDEIHILYTIAGG